MSCNNTYYFSIVFITIILSTPCGNIKATNRNPTISLNIKNTALSNVVEDLQRQIQYQIVLGNNCGNPIFSGDYENVPLDSLFNRLFKNTIILIDDNEQVIHLDCVRSNNSSLEYGVSVEPYQNTDESRHDKMVLRTHLNTEELNLNEVSLIDPVSVSQPAPMTLQGFDEMVDSETGLTFREMEKQLDIKID